MRATDDQLKRFRRACTLIIDNQKLPSVNWAVNYARHGMEVTDQHEMKVQALYIKGNITHWRGAEALETRTILSSLIKEIS